MAVKLLSLSTVALIVAMAIPQTAAAWTEAHIDRVAAVVDVQPDGEATVTLNLSIEVHRGWLSALELGGLAPGLKVITRRAVLRSDEGERFVAAVDVDPEGSLTLAFERREAPRRGRYRTSIQYRTMLSDAPTAVGARRDKARWTLPAWETGLNGVVIEARLPQGAKPIVTDQPAGVSVKRTTRGTKTSLRWERVHLPRMTPWTVSFELPSARQVPDKSQVATVAAAIPTPLSLALDRSAPASPHAPTFLIGVLLALCCLLKRVTGTLKPLITLSMPSTIATFGALLVLTETPWLWLGWLGMLAMALKKKAKPTAAMRLGQWTQVRAAERERKRERFEPGHLCDVTTWPGIASLMAFTAAASVSLDAQTSIVAITVFLAIVSTGTRLHSGISPQARLQTLLGFFRNRTTPSWANGLAYGPVAYAAPDGQWLDARLRVHSEEWVSGVQSVDLVVGDLPVGLALRPTIGFLIVTRSASCAEDLVRGNLRSPTCAYRSPALTAFFVPWSHAALRVVRELVSDPDAEAERDSGTWIFRYGRTAA